MFNSESYKTSSISTCISCVVMCTLLYVIEAESLETVQLLFYILAIAVLYFKEKYEIEAISIKLNI